MTAAFRLDLAGLEPGPAQVWGGVRLVPLLRAAPVEGLRLHAELYRDGFGSVVTGPRTTYTSYIPHGFVADWGADAGQRGPAAAYGTQLRGGQGGQEAVAGMPLSVHRRMARREAKHRLRFLPLHLALEGLLSLHFGGPSIAWAEWSRQALRHGLSPRVEEAYLGADVRGLDDALRVFEVHPGQCGLALYVADALAAVFAVPHPADYRALHDTLLLDLYGELVYQYALFGAALPDYRPALGDPGSVPELRAAVAREERAWRAFHDGTMAAGLLDGEYRAQRVHRAGPFTLHRFLPAFRPRQENHIGEAITAADGRIAYLKTFRLSEAQVRRGHLLSRLAAHDWHFADTAADLGLTPAELAQRLRSAGVAHLLRQDLADAARRPPSGRGAGSAR
ncbi:ARPP-2 domain-containing protein [Streptomyces sp. CA2R106]|uniref:ARPP-2 domain-containing protein n=1 Tax=Streptomyces sp. CA2R106 TaxID=3120153 RepID=UPI00300A08A5